MPNPIPHLETVTAKDLLTQPIEPLRFTIDTILPHGLFILSGSAKTGKSWLALDMSNAVANGGQLWNYPATQGDVLYLALEDTKKRSQERINKISAVCNLNCSTDIHFVHKVQKLGNGLTEQITEFLDNHPQTKLIVIDTLQYIRNNGKSVSTYSADYRDMDALREIIDDRELTMLIITHNFKGKATDPLNKVYGSAGLTGAVDGIFVLEKNRRTGDNARLTIANRDTESHEFELRFDNQNCRWQFVAETGKDTDPDDQLCELLIFLLDETFTWSGTSTQLCDALAALEPTFNLSPIALSKLLKSRQDFLRIQHCIECVFTRTKTARLIELSRDVIVVDCENVKPEPLRLVG
jgi:hypothetical protein